MTSPAQPAPSAPSVLHGPERRPDVGEPAADSSFERRRDLVHGAIAALAVGDLIGAGVLLNAAIRRARRFRLFDLEAEYLRFVVLYVSESYAEAINRCVECLNGLADIEEDAVTWPTARLPTSQVRKILERALLRVMVDRGDGFVALVRQLHTDSGKTYRGKWARPLNEAVAIAWSATHRPFSFGVETLREGIHLFGIALEEIHAEREASGEETGVDPDWSLPMRYRRAHHGPAPEADEAPVARPAASAESDDPFRLFDEIADGPGECPHDSLKDVMALCRHVHRPEEVARLARMHARLPGWQARKVLNALKINRDLGAAFAHGRLAEAGEEGRKLLRLAFGER